MHGSVASGSAPKSSLHPSRVGDHHVPPPWPLGAITLRFQLDHVMYEGRVEAIAGGIIEAGPSDHKPVWAGIALRDAI